MDKLKITLLAAAVLLLAWAVYLLHERNAIGRYQFSADGAAVLDTAEGLVYIGYLGQSSQVKRVNIITGYQDYTHKKGAP